MRRAILLIFLCITAIISFSRFADADEWRYPVGISYVSGFGDIADALELNLIADEEADTDPGAQPFGLSFQPYLQFDNGMRVGGGIGPFMFAYGNVRYSDIPININVGYTFNPIANIAPYFRLGLIQHLIVYEDYKSSYPGFFGAVGVELFNNQRVSLGIELSYDTTDIKMDVTKLIQFYDILGQPEPYKSLSTVTDVFSYGYALSLYAIF
jgi:hypothetical protein